AVLASGQVLVAGGGAVAGELFDPASQTFTPAGPTLTQTSGDCRARTLLDERILIGCKDDGAATNDSDVFTAGGGFSFAYNADLFVSHMTPIGRVLLADSSGLREYDPVTNAVLTAAASMTGPLDSSVPLPDGRVFLVMRGSPNQALVYDSQEPA